MNRQMIDQEEFTFQDFFPYGFWLPELSSPNPALARVNQLLLERGGGAHRALMRSLWRIDPIAARKRAIADLASEGAGPDDALAAQTSIEFMLKHDPRDVVALDRVRDVLSRSLSQAELSLVDLHLMSSELLWSCRSDSPGILEILKLTTALVERGDLSDWDLKATRRHIELNDKLWALREAERTNAPGRLSITNQ